MRLRPLATLAVAATMAFGVFCLGLSPAKAESDLGSHKKTNMWWGSNSYKIFQYPSKTNSFFFYPHSFVTFDVMNGKYWMYEHGRAEYEVADQNSIEHVVPQLRKYPQALNVEKMTVTFYTPDMKVLAVYRNAKMAHIYSIPRDGNDYERIICKMEFAGANNQDMKLRVWDAVDPVMAEPSVNDRDGR